MNIRLTMSLPCLLLVSSVFAQDTVQVSAGWNIIGSIKAGTVAEVLSTDPPGLITMDFYGYSPGSGYQPSDTLEKGVGYWVKASADGVIIFTASGTSGCGTDTVLYAGTTYGTVKIGDQCWLDRNLDVGTMVPGASLQFNNGVIEKHCYNDDSLNCLSYGGLYQWMEALQYDTANPGTQGICPSGWHIPTYGELQTLGAALGDNANALKALGQGSGAGAGTNTSGFGALLAGLRWGPGNFANIGADGVFWSSTAWDFFNAQPLGVSSLSGDIGYDPPGYGFKGNGFSVRCLEN